MDKVNVSVIIPVYNAEKTLNRCKDSLFSQTLQEMEFIFIDDASADESGSLLDEYVKQDKRAKVIHSKTNGGAGGARNLGLDCAEGEYIGFVDADDFVKADMFEDLYKKAKEKDYDVVDCPFYDLKADELRLPGIKDVFCDRTLSKDQKEVLLLSDGYIWTKLIKSSLLSENHIRFRKNVKLEDADFLLKVMLHADYFGNISDPKYIYDNTSQSETWSVRGAASSEFDNVLSLLKEYGRVLKHDKCAKECRNAIEGAILHFYRMGIECCLDDNEETMSEENIRKLLHIRKVKNNIFAGGYDNPYFLQTANESVIGFMKWVDDLKQ